MAEFDWMRDPAFRSEIEASVSSAAERAGMKRFQAEVVNQLMQHLAENRELLVEQEMTKTAGLRRSKSEALACVEELVKQASRYASADGRTLVRAADLDEAYEARYCMVWPFCGKGKQ
jgi:hypothetical protein